jgi:hypothetical protein
MARAHGHNNRKSLDLHLTARALMTVLTFFPYIHAHGAICGQEKGEHSVSLRRQSAAKLQSGLEGKSEESMQIPEKKWLKEKELKSLGKENHPSIMLFCDV